MNWRSTLLLVLLALSAILFLTLSGRNRTHPANKPLLTFDPESIDAIVIREGGLETVLRRQSGVWKLASGTPDRADSATVRALLATLPDLVPLDRLDPSELKGAVSLQALDLAKPKRSVTVVAGARSRTLLLGAEGAAKARIYARVDGEAPVYLVPSGIADIAFRSPESFRDSKFTRLDASRAGGISVLVPAGVPGLVLRRDPRGWMLTEPVAALADEGSVTRWIDSLLTADIERWMPPGTDPATCGLARPEALVTVREPLSAEAGSTAPSLTIALGSDVPGSPGNRFATCSDRPGICVLKGAGEFPGTTAASLRSRHPSPFQNDAIDRIEVSFPRSPLPVVIERQKGGEDWILRHQGSIDRTIAGERVDAWLSTLKDLPVTDFRPLPRKQEGVALQNGGAGGPHQPPGTQSRMTIRLLARLSENSAEENAGQTVLEDFSLDLPGDGEASLLQKGTPDIMIVPPERARGILTEFLNWTVPEASPSPSSPPRTPAS